jgi:NAD+ diphosphatase
VSFLFEEAVAGFEPSPEELDRSDALAFVFVDDRMVLPTGAERPMTLAEAEAAGVELLEVTPLGRVDGRAAVVALAREPLPGGFSAKVVRRLFGRLPLETIAVAAYASQIAHFVDTHRFCGRCGGVMVPSASERLVRCEVCKRDVYPRISPCIIILVDWPTETGGSRILLTRARHFPEGMYGLVAGFVEPGESLEACAKREVMEETGILIRDVRYIASQPWPFPSQLMLGFTASYESGELKVDTHELEDANWFELDALPQIPPPLSIARHLIDLHLDAQKR